MPEHLQPWSRRWPRALARALLPSCCALCGDTCGAALCGPCHRQYAAPRRRRCACCANPIDDRGQGTISDQLIENCAVTPVLAPGLCGACLADRPVFDATVVAADYASPLDQLVLQLKFGARLALAPWFAQMLRDAVLGHPGFELPDLLCPVPLGPRRLAERGFNQALEIARPLAAALGIELQPRLAVRARDTLAQSGVAPAERQANIRDAFSVAPAALERIAGRHVGVVDDVMTSGYTLNELAAELKRCGAARVSNLVFARTPPH